MRLLIIVLTLLVISLGALSGLSYYFAKQALSSSVDETVTAIGNDYAKRVQGSINEVTTYLLGASNNPNIRPNVDRQTLIAALADVKKRSGKLDAVNFVYLDGTTIRYDGSVINLADRDYLQRAIRLKQAVISEPLIAKGTGKASVIIVVPILDNGNIVGLINGTKSLDNLNELVKEIKFKDSGYGAIIDVSGLVLAHPNTDLVGKLNMKEKKINADIKLGAAELDDRLIDLVNSSSEGDKQVSGTYTSTDNVETVAVLTPINLPGNQHWAFMLATPEAEIAQTVGKLTKALISITFAAVLLAGLFVLYISKKFTQPIINVRDEALILARGDLRERKLVFQSQDEIGQLVEAYNKMTSNLRNFVYKVQTRAEVVASASEELTATSFQCSEVANQVADSIAQIAQGSEKEVEAVNNMLVLVKEMSSNIEQIEEVSKTIMSIANETSQSTDKGKEAIIGAVQQMKKIGEGAKDVQNTIGELSKGSREIGEIVSLISSIAGQTNLLALNAAIEAARAGEAGKGFAVVADEVRKLAEQSNQATQKIADLIQKNEAAMCKAICAAQASGEGVNLGAQVVESAGSTFMKIAQAVQRLTDQFKDVVQAVDKIAAGSQELSIAVVCIDKVCADNASGAQGVAAATEEQAAAMEEVAASSRSLAQVSVELKEATDNFKVS